MATEQFDVVVIGSGPAGEGAALTAAVLATDHGASAMVVEKGDTVGGTSAISGGIVWFPNNPHQAENGIEDSREDALAYLQSLSLGVMDMELAAAFVDNGPGMVRYRSSTPRLMVPSCSGSANSARTSVCSATAAANTGHRVVRS